MKTLIPCIVSLLIGAAIGWIAGQSHAKPQTTQTAKEMTQSLENADAVAAKSSMTAIDLVESGKNEELVRFLCSPIVRYYYTHAVHAGTNEPAVVRMRGSIEQMANRNKILADQLVKQKKNFEMLQNDM